MATFKLDLGKYADKAKKDVIDGINESLVFMKQYAEDISPEDTRTFVKNHEIETAKEVQGKIEGKLTNDTPYAAILEYGVKGKAYNYHKGRRKGPRKVIHTGVGNRTYTRTLDLNRQKVVDTIKNKVLQGLDKK